MDINNNEQVTPDQSGAYIPPTITSLGAPEKILATLESAIGLPPVS